MIIFICSVLSIYSFLIQTIIISEINLIQPEKSLTLFSSILFEVFIFKKKMMINVICKLYCNYNIIISKNRIYLQKFCLICSYKSNA